MTPEQSLAIEQACAAVFNRFSVLNDAGRHEEMVQLFTEDARFARPTDPDNYTEGRDQILAAFQARPKDRVTRHLITNIVIDVVDETTAKGQCYSTLYAGSPDKPAENLGLQANPEQFIGEFFADFRLTDEGWKISSQTGNITFTT